jgi:hypothetical protein
MTNTQPVEESALSLLHRVLQTEDESLLAEVRQRSAEILEQLDKVTEGEGQSESRLELSGVSSEWVAKVYAALSGVTDAEAQAIEDEATVKQMLEARTNWEASIGAAFAQALVPDWLPPDVLNLEAWFDRIPKAPPARVAQLQQTPAASAGGPVGQQLCVYGLTPLTVYRAIHSVYLLTDRLLDYEYLLPDQPILLGTPPASVATVSQRLDPVSVVTAIDEYADCSRDTSECLIRWMISLGQFHPCLFYGLEATPFGKEALLLRVSEQARSSNVYQRWSVLAARGAGANG